MKTKVINLSLLFIFMLAVIISCTPIQNSVGISGYKYKFFCPSVSDLYFYANAYDVDYGTIVLYDAYVFIWDWKHVDTYKYPNDAGVSIEKQ